MSNRNFKVDKALRNGADLIRKNKWWQSGSFDAPDGGFCMMMAINNFDDREKADLMIKAASRMGFDGVWEAIKWNDQTGRTVEEVIARMEGAISADIVRI